ncbi:acyl-homoserine-lactone synthase [Telmatospirillum sp.]|uniref:acyl-homoserine-lactone synthase n=1 Tax=Telmatospirillum sp. TaxID=2079197 RepID=UPI0028497C4B|nr:acyl-homoserine-lactone synthase [Telmatospirillum sp.]MDR3438110.1 acyl-homoserine-lactone synthase [Telmatospirillum sp.]
MLHILPFRANWRPVPELRAMFMARKRVFVDLLGWTVPVHDGLYEIDQFDRAGAIYLILTDDNGAHRASARLLPTERAHLLDTYFTDLCAASPPCGPAVREITRFCLDRRLRAAERRLVRDELVKALVNHALGHGITTYTGVAEMAWFQQILAFGWQCRALGLPREHEGQQLAALRIDITPDTPEQLASAGIAIGLEHGEKRHAA